MKTEAEIKDRLVKLQERWANYSRLMSVHERTELGGQIHALEWILDKK